MTDKKSRNQAALFADYQRAFKDGPGRKVLLDLMNTHHVMGPLFDKDPLEMAFSEGERNVVLRILSYLKVDTQKMFADIEEAEKQNEDS